MLQDFLIYFLDYICIILFELVFFRVLIRFSKTSIYKFAIYIGVVVVDYLFHLYDFELEVHSSFFIILIGAWINTDIVVYQKKIASFFMYIFAAFYLGIVVEPIELLYTFFYRQNIYTMQGDRTAVLIVDCISTIFLLLIFFVQKKMNIKNLIWNVSVVQWLVAIMVGVFAQLVFLAISYALHDLNENYWISIIMLVLNILMFICGFTFLIYCSLYVTIKQKNMQQEVTVDALKRYYLSLKASEYEVRAIRHDILKHIHMINALLEEKHYYEAEKYAKQLTGEFGISTKKIVNAGHLIASAIFSDCLRKCMDKNIVFSITGVIRENIKMTDVDLCTILSNLLDNSVEACDSCLEENSINVKLSSFQNDIYIYVANTYSKEQNEQNRMKKKKSKEHGYGLENVKKTVYKYGGSVRIEAGDIYEVEIFIPDIYDSEVL